MSAEQKIISPRWESFLKALADRIAEPTSDQPTARCWSLTSLATMVQDIKLSGLPSTFPDTPEILRHLINIGWAYPIDVEVPTSMVPRSKKFYLLDVGAARGTNVDPLELLQAYRPKGVLCYFSALTYHSLTTQFATHHHIATLSKTPSVQKASSKTPLTDKIEEAVASNRTFSLGEKLFNYQGVPYYLTKRNTSSVIGVQTRIIGPRTNIRITTLEQTLLDTLHKPKYCGGPSIIFEAWEEGITRFDDDLLIDYLQKFDSTLFLRRVGAMLELFNFTPSSKLASTLERALHFSSPNYITDAIPILPGFEFQVLNPKWKVMTP